VLFFVLQNQHIAASQGKENCVLLLLDYGADPNITGTYFLPLKLYWLHAYTIRHVLRSNDKNYFDSNTYQNFEELWKMKTSMHDNSYKVRISKLTNKHLYSCLLF